MKRGIRVGAVLLGVLADKASFLVLAGVLATVVAPSSPRFFFGALVLGTATTALGAYVAARRARTAFLTHGLLVAGVGFAISFGRYVTFAVHPPEDPGAVHPFSWELLGWSLVVAAGVLGGSLARYHSMNGRAAVETPSAGRG